ncbi:MAG: type II CRISPR RNA-guided endonuclease Cas9 [Phycisphaerales bacterium]|nr:type II CRISPR RNA-guided endonuclease Cas9 [Phycisphaerales bacterium]
MEPAIRYGLGLDQGVASIGWAVLRLDDTGTPMMIERLGTHLFEAGTEGDIEGGRDESRAAPRRMARQLRKQYRRRVLRKIRLLRWLQELGLLPAGDISTAEGRDALIKGLDEELRKKWEAGNTVDHRTRQLLPYRLRAAGLTDRLEPFELGRALYHLAQRRGYLSNRKAQKATEDPGDAAKGTRAAKPKGSKRGNPIPPPDAQASMAVSDATPPAEESKGQEDPSVVRAAIVELQKQMQGAGCTTLAKYFSTLDPTGTLGDRLRGRWTAREMFLEEFGRIVTEQSRHHTVLTEEVRRKLHRAIFFQRPLQSMNHLIGACELMPGKKRCPLGHRVAQRFRMLQRVNDLVIRLPDYTQRPLSRAERERLINALQNEGDITFATLKTKKWFGLPKGTTFNLEEGGNKKLLGNRTEAKCRRIFGAARWDAMSEADKNAVVHDLLIFEKPEALARRGEKVWGLEPDAAAALGDCILEPGFAAHSREALETFIVRMEEGTSYATALKEEFGKGPDAHDEVHDLLPPVEKALGQLRNPTVTRALTELRKLINAIVRRYGKPAWIRLELARDLKRARKHRERMSREMRAQEARREDARARILQEANIPHASRADIERVLLAEECGWVCPYTGKGFGMTDIVGRHPRVDVEHIRPLSRSLDDSYLNKTLCFVDENRNVKKNRTPFEAYAGQPERWNAILDRVKRFRGDARVIKLERFQDNTLPDDFAQRHLAETRKIAAETAAYLGLLYGGECDATHTRRIFVTTGGLTAHLRREWHLNAVLSDDPGKNRDDHRHHAIDALVVALTDTRTVQVLQRAAEQASALGRRLFAPVDEPWPGFLDAVREKVEAINVSHRQSRRISGKLHAETNYSRPTGPSGERRIRKELGKLTEKEIERIVDPKVRAAVDARIKELGLVPKGKSKVYSDFADRSLHPFTLTKKGEKNWIHKVRLATGEKPRPVGKGPRARFVTSTPGSNHHTLIQQQPSGKWTDAPVSLLELKTTSAAIKRPHGGSSLTLAANDFVLMQDKTGVERLYRVLSVSGGDIEFIAHTDARIASERKTDRTRGGAAALIKKGLRKVSITYLGEIRRAGG